jgi:hypothetical protein
MTKTEEKKQIEQELENRTTDRGLLRYGWDYYKAFIEVYKNHPKDTEMYQVKFYLLCHSLELALKAFLKHKGYTRKQLINNFGHDLEKLLLELYRKYELIFDKESAQRIFHVNQYYNTKQFEYFQTGYKELVDINKLGDVTKLMLSKVESKINFLK